MANQNLRRQLVWLLIFRLVVVTSLVVSQVFLEALVARPVWAGAPFYLVLSCPFLLTFVYLALFKLGVDDRINAYLQFLGDVLVISAILYWTGGLFSPFANFFFVVVIVSAALLYRQGSLVVASEAFVAYGVIVLLTYTQRLPPIPSIQERYEELTVRQAYLWLFLYMLGLYAVAWLTSRLSEGVRREGSRAERTAIRVRELEAFHRTLVESMTVGLLTTDEEGRISFASSSAQEILGRSDIELEGEEVDEKLLGPGGFDRIRVELVGRPLCRTEVRRELPGGGEIQLAVTASRLGGPVVGYLFLVEDRTQIHRLEEELRLKDRMAALGEMAAGLAHEIRNPLASMTGSVEVLGDDLDLEGDHERLLRIVKEESKRLDGIIRDFLDYARPGSLARDRVDLKELARETLDLFRHSKEVPPSVDLRLEGPEDVTCEVDANQVRQVVWNLLRNARDAMKEGGSLHLEVGRQGDWVFLSVRDSGSGMSEAERLAAVQPFYSGSGEGVGLGLTIVYRIVRDHGGRIDIDSKEGEGTEIVVWLPSRVPASRSGRREAAP